MRLACAKVSKVCLWPEQLPEWIIVPGGDCRGLLPVLGGTVALLVQGWPSTSQGTPAPCPGCQGEVPGGHIPAHTGKRPHHSPSSARQSSPRYWARQVPDNYSGPPLERTETDGEENGPAQQVSAGGNTGSREGEGASMLGLLYFQLQASTSQSLHFPVHRENPSICMTQGLHGP